jgi:hypothetical protein
LGLSIGLSKKLSTKNEATSSATRRSVTNRTSIACSGAQRARGGTTGAAAWNRKTLWSDT